MTVGTAISKIQVTGTDAPSAETIEVSFPFIEADDLVVTQTVTATGVSTVLTLGTHYTITGGNYSTGVVSVTSPAGEAVYTAAMTWTVERRTDRTQATDWVENDQFSAESLEKSQDKQTLIAQDVGEEAGRALKIPIGDPSSTSSELPSKVDRALKTLGFDAAGEPTMMSGTVSGDVTVNAFMEPVLGAASASDAKTLLEVTGSVLSAQADIIVGGGGGAETRLVKGVANAFLKMNAGATNITWSAEAIPVLGGGSDGGKNLQANSDGTAFEVVTPVLSKQNASSDWLITTGTTIADNTGTVVHGLEEQPHIVIGVLECTIAEHGYILGNRVIPHMQINIDATKSDGGLTFWWDNTNMGYGITAAANLHIVHKTAGTVHALTEANWKVMMRAFA